MAEPAASDPAGMVIDASPPLSVATAEVYEPLVSVMEPVGVGLPVPPLTATVTDNACAVVMLADEGVTATAGLTCCAVSGVVAEVLAL